MLFKHGFFPDNRRHQLNSLGRRKHPYQYGCKSASQSRRQLSSERFVCQIFTISNETELLAKSQSVKTNLSKPGFQKLIDTTRFFLQVGNLLSSTNFKEFHVAIIDKGIIKSSFL